MVCAISLSTVEVQEALASRQDVTTAGRRGRGAGAFGALRPEVQIVFLLRSSQVNVLAASARMASSRLLVQSQGRSSQAWDTRAGTPLAVVQSSYPSHLSCQKWVS